MTAFDPSSKNEVLKIINNVALFMGIGLHEQGMLADKCYISEHKANEIIIEQGDVANKMYVIIEGSVLVSVKHGSAQWKRINLLAPGDVFGEIAIVRNIPRTARITTLTPSTFLTISDKDFLAAYQYFPPKARDNIQLVIAKRLKENQSYAQ
ncbi:cyclic nucleotide-binding domain-containing protein [Legionella sp.]|uniref:cyclic nucleotide-binding domain-containing protein n=1 Tax=Legionella sp. TaxID=459 RepID=UPI000CB4C8F1|nr:cyclic nucleotide-binding domain-containing protein [Legionella sp.]PJE10584.1 MAG: cyclic nucleotide-binding protein [Legionella sp.]